MVTDTFVNVANELNLSAAAETQITEILDRGGIVTVPKDNVHLNDWVGAVYLGDEGTSILYAIHADQLASGGYSTTKNVAPKPQTSGNNHFVTTSAGDPVNVASGNMYRDDVDLMVPSIGLPIAFARHYDAQETEDFGMGVGWSYSFGDRLVISSDSVEWITSVGHRHRFLEDNAGSYDVPASLLGGELVVDGSGNFVFTDKQGLQHKFNSSGSLLEIRDRNKNALALVYTSGQLVKVQEEFSGQAAVDKLTFTYQNGKIKTVTDFDNRTWTYDYQTIDHSATVQKSHLIRSSSPGALGTSLAVVEYGYFDNYTSDGPLVGLMNEITEPNGGAHTYSYYLNKRSFEVEDAEGYSTHIQYDVHRNHSRFVDERGHATIYTYDDRSLPLRTYHPDGARTINTWDIERQLMTSSTNLSGIPEQYLDFDADGNLGTLIERDGVVTEFTYTSFANVATVSRAPNTANERIAEFTYDTNGNRTHAVDAAGNETTFTYLTGGLLASKTEPKGNLTLTDDDYTTFYEYDDQLRLVAVTRATLDGNYAYDPGDGPTYSFPSGFDAPSGSWELATDGRLHAVDEVNGALMIRQGAHESPSHSVRATFAFAEDSNGAAGALGLVVHYEDASNFYFAELDHVTQTVRLVQVENGVSQTLAATPIDVAPTASVYGSNYDVALYADGEILRLYVQDTLVATADAEPPASSIGQTGIRMGAGGRDDLVTATVLDFRISAAPTTTYSYDSRWNRAKVIDPSGLATTYSYDLLNRAISTSLPDPDGLGPLEELVTTTTYNGMGDILTMTDARSNTTRYTYDLKQNLIEIQAPDNTKTSYEYDGARNLIRATDALQRETETSYDERNRAEIMLYADQSVSITRFDGDGRVEATVDGNGNAIRFSYDPMGRLLTATDALGGVSTNEYDAVGNLNKIIDVRSEVTLFKHDLLDRVTATSGPEGTLTTSEYDANGNVDQVVHFETDGLLLDVVLGTSTIAFAPGFEPSNIAASRQRSTQFEYDNLNRLVSQTNALDQTTHTAYDAAGRVLAQTDQLGGVARSRYDGAGRLVAEVLPDPDGALGVQESPVTTYRHDENGNTVEVSDALGRVTEFTYDSHNRPTHTTDAAGETAEVVFDLAGQTTTTIDTLGRATSNEYDVRGRRIRQTLADPDRDGSQLAPVQQWEYDAVGNVTKQTDANENVVSYAYDVLNRVTKQFLPTPFTEYTQTVDDDEIGYSESGAWFDSNPQVGFESDSRVAVNGGSEDAAFWNFPIEPGVYQVGMTWTVFTNLATDAHVTIFDGQNEIASLTVDQTSYPQGAMLIDSVLWMPLGVVYVATGDLVVKLTEGATGELTMADAVRVDLVSGPYTEFSYDAAGNLLSETDPLGRVTSRTYDGLGRQLSVTMPDPDGAANPLDAPSTTYHYNSLGEKTSEVDHLGRTTSFTYDELSRRETLTQPDPDGAGNPLPAPVTTTSYDAVGNVETVTDQLGRVTRYAYDQLNRLVSTTLDDGGADELTTSYSYDAVGNRLTRTDNGGRVSESTYDVLNQLVTSTSPDPDGFGPALAPQTVRQYDAVGNLLSSSNALNETTVYTYDQLNRQTEVTNPNGEITKYQYDFIGNLLTFTDPEFNITTYEYDEFNRRVSESIIVNSSVLTRSFTYDLVGNLLEETDRNNRVRTYEYDSLDRLILEEWANDPSQRSFTWTYDNAGRLGESTSLAAAVALSSSTYTYDDLDRVKTHSIDNWDAPESVVFTKHYDALGNLIEREDAVDGVTVGSVNYEYDRLNRVTRIEETGTTVADKAVQYHYDAVGNVAQLDRYADLENAEHVLSTFYAYDFSDRLTAVRHGGQAMPAAFHGYQFDAAGRTTEVLTFDGAAQYSYDEAGQITDANHSYQDNEAYGYDDNGNRTGGGYSTGDHNRLLSDGVYNYLYDNEGNRTRRTEIASGDYVVYEWDYRNRLTSVAFYNSSDVKQKEVSYRYDSSDRRVERMFDADGTGGAVETARYVYHGNDVTLVFDADGDQTHRYLHGAAVDEVLADEDALGDVTWPLADRQNTVRDVVEYDLESDIATIAEHLTYGAFGDLTSGATEQIFTYTGREWDADAELYYYRARWYDATTGRFLSPDPSGFDAGDPNLYRYVNNSPMLFVDPSGMRAVTPRDSLFSSADVPITNAVRQAFNTHVPLDASMFSSFLPWAISYPRQPSVESMMAIPNPAVPAHLSAPRPLGLLPGLANATRSLVNLQASGIEWVGDTASDFTGNSTFTASTAFAGSLTRQVGNAGAGVIDFPATLRATVNDVQTSIEYGKQFGVGVGAARQVGLLSFTESYYDIDVMTATPLGDQRINRLADGFGRVGSTAGTLAGALKLTGVSAPPAAAVRLVDAPRSEATFGGYLSPTKVSDPWMPGKPTYGVPAPKGLEIEMVMSPGQTRPGGWGTVDIIADASYARNKLAIIPEFKPELGFVQKFSVPEGTRIQYGTAGPQTHGGIVYPGGGSQIQILNYADRAKLVPIGNPMPLK